MQSEAEAAVATLIRYVGQSPDDPGLKNTPRRLCSALHELTDGYGEDPQSILATQFTAELDEVVLVRAIPFWSLCEHHLLPFNGTATVAYIPAGRVVGLSKIPRLVACFSRRLQIQEQLTVEIADAMMKHLKPVGAACIVQGHHTCMQMRGIRSQGAMITSCLRGAFIEDARARSELMQLINGS